MSRFGWISEILIRSHALRCCWLPALLLLGTANPGFAEIRVAPSLEWLSCSADAIVIGNCVRLTATPGPGDVIYEDYVVEVQEVVKGDLKDKQINFTWRQIDASQSAMHLLKAKRGVLLFLAKSKDHGPEQRMNDKWVPLTPEGNPWIVDLSKLPKGIFSKEMKSISEEPEMLRIVREWAKSPVKQSLWLEVPFESPIFNQLYSGSSCYLMVPAEEKYRAGFMTLARSREAHDRAKAASELAKYAGKETEAVLRELLKDDAESVSHYANDEIASVNYHVRAAAYQSLKALGQQLPEVAMERKPTAVEQRALREKAWKASFAQALKDGWTITVTDGPSRVVDQREQFIVRVTCNRQKDLATFTLVPKDWPLQGINVEGMEYLGTNGLHNQGGRRFYRQGELPGEVTKAIIAYFGLEK